MAIPRGGALALLLSAVLSARPVAHAQEWTRWEIGLKSGVSRTSFTEGTEFAWDRSNPAGAAFMRRRITDWIFVQPEVALSRKVGVSALPASALTLLADYIELPLMLQLHVVSVSALGLYVTGGPGLAIRLRCRLQFDGGGLRTEDECDTARGAQSNRVDFAVNGGAGAVWSPGPFTLSAEWRYTTGLRPYVLPIDAARARTYGWSALAGVAVPLARARSAPGTRLPGPVFSSPMPRETRAHEPYLSTPTVELSSTAVNPMGFLISVDADDVDAHEVFAGIARAVGISIEVSPLVRTRITIALTDVTVDAALSAIVYKAGLAMVRSREVGQPRVTVHPLPTGNR